MRRFLVAFAIFSLSCQLVTAQDKKIKIKYGKISEEEIAMTSCPIDPTAAAVVLFDKGEYSHYYNSTEGFVFEFERHIRIKIFNKEAYTHADVRLLHYKDQRILDLKASSYNLEAGKLVETKLGDENSFEEELTKRISVKKFSIPAVREGSIIEYKYRQKNVALPDWEFQRIEIPTLWSEFTASVPDFVDFQKASSGWVTFSVAEEKKREETINTNIVYDTNVMHYLQENVPALQPEPFVLSPKEYLSRITFDVRAIYKTRLESIGGSQMRVIKTAPQEMNETWYNLGRELLEETFESPITASRFGEDVSACTAGKNTQTEKLSAIYEFIGKNYETNSLSSLWPSQKMESLAKNRKGTATDLNLVLINMLKKAGVSAYPVAISTRPNGMILSFRVSATAFDQVITAVQNEDNSYTLVDAAGWPNPIGLLPEDDLNHEGLLLKSKDHIEWIPLQNKTYTRSAVAADLNIEAEGNLKGAFNFSENGYGAVQTRHRVKKGSPDQFLQEKFKTLLSDAQFSNVKMEQLDSWQEPAVKGSFDLAQESAVTVNGDKMYLQPILGLGMKENPFKNPERKFNIELGVPRSTVYNFIYHLPAGYKVEEAPKSIKMNFGENALSFEYFVENGPGVVKIICRQNIKNPYILAENYADLQEYYGAIVAKMEEQIVLTKN